MLTTHRCFGCGWTVLAQYQGFIDVPYSVPAVSVLRVGAKLGGNMAGTADPNSPKGYLWHVTSCWATKTEVEEEIFKRFWFLSWFPRQLLFGGRLDISQPVEGGEWFPLFCVFLSTKETAFILTHKFSRLCCFPSHWWEEEGTISCVGAWLLAGVDSPQKHREQMVFRKFVNGQLFSVCCAYGGPVQKWHGVC